MDQTMDQSTRTELEAAVYRRLVEHLRTRTDVQNIEMMNLAGFCRNCLSNWKRQVKSTDPGDTAHSACAVLWMSGADA
jgi:hypothetical protein